MTNSVWENPEERVAYGVGLMVTRYLVDDLNPTGYAQVVEESVNGSGSVLTALGMRVMHHRVSDGFGCEAGEGEDGERDLDAFAAQLGG